MPYKNEHAVRIKDPGLFIPSSFRSKEIKTGIRIIIGKLKDSNSDSMVTQAYRFSSDLFTMEEVKKWLKDNNVTSYLKIESAQEEMEASQGDDNSLEHYGVLGMRWGVRNKVVSSAKAVGGHFKTAVTPSSDHKQYMALRRKKVQNLTDDELGVLVKRMKLMKTFRKSGEYAKKQEVAMTNAELERASSRAGLRKAIAKSSSLGKKRHWKDFIKSFKMSKSEAEKLTKRIAAEKEYDDLRYEDYNMVKKLINLLIFVDG